MQRLFQLHDDEGFLVTNRAETAAQQRQCRGHSVGRQVADFHPLAVILRDKVPIKAGLVVVVHDRRFALRVGQGGQERHGGGLHARRRGQRSPR